MMRRRWIGVALAALPLLFGGFLFFRLVLASVKTSAVVFENAPRSVLTKVGVEHSDAPSLFFSASGRVYVLAGMRQGERTALGVFLSENGGDTFGSPTIVAPPGAIMTHSGMSPVFAHDQRSMYALWEETLGGNGVLRVAHGSMFGRAFSPPSVVVDKAGSFFTGFASLGVAPNGDVYAVWLDGRSVRASADTFDVEIARSTDGGATFGSNIRVAHDACPCCRPSFAFGSDGTVYLAWRQDFPGDYRDIVASRSKDDGKNWSVPVRVSSDGWSIRGCPHSGPTLTVRDGTLHVAWYTLGREGRARVLASSSRDGMRFTPPVTVSGNIEDANRPRFVDGTSRFPLLVFEGRDPGGAGFGPVHVFVTALGEGGWTKPQGVPSGGREMRDPVAAMRDARTLYIMGTLLDENKASVALVRGRLP